MGAGVTGQAHFLPLAPKKSGWSPGGRSTPFSLPGGGTGPGVERSVFSETWEQESWRLGRRLKGVWAQLGALLEQSEDQSDPPGPECAF